MADILMWESPSSGKISNAGKRIELIFFLTGTDDKWIAFAHVLANTEDVLGGLPRDDFQLEVREGHTDLWDISVIYATGNGSGSTDSVEIGQETISFTTRGDAIRIFQAGEHIADYGQVEDLGLTPPNHKGAINVTTERVEGIEIDNAGFVMQITRIVADSEFTPQYNRALFLATNKVNSSTWRGFEPGELRLLGVDVNQRDSESWTVTFEFLGIQNIIDGQVGELTGIIKEGHHYAWSEHEDFVDESVEPPRKRKKLIAVHVERVYDYIDFAQHLGLNLI